MIRNRLVKDIHLTPMNTAVSSFLRVTVLRPILPTGNYDKYGSFGTLEYIMNSYNKDIVTKYPGRKPVSSPAEFRGQERETV